MSEPSISITLPASQWQAIGSALSELPFKVAQPIILAIGQQMQAQEVKPQPAADLPSPKTARRRK